MFFSLCILCILCSLCSLILNSGRYYARISYEFIKSSHINKKIIIFSLFLLMLLFSSMIFILIWLFISNSHSLFLMYLILFLMFLIFSSTIFILLYFFITFLLSISIIFFSLLKLNLTSISNIYYLKLYFLKE